MKIMMKLGINVGENIMGIIAIILGWLGLISGNLVWIGHGIYQLFTTELGFFEVVLTNGLFWLIQMVVSLVVLLIGLDKG